MNSSDIPLMARLALTMFFAGITLGLIALIYELWF